MESNREISPVILSAINIMRKSFGGTDVQLISEGMFRTEPSEFKPIGALGVTIEIEGIRTFLGYEIAEDMLSPYGYEIAEAMVFEVIKVKYPDVFSK